MNLGDAQGAALTPSFADGSACRCAGFNQATASTPIFCRTILQRSNPRIELMLRPEKDTPASSAVMNV
jgi:hypothetical protein